MSVHVAIREPFAFRAFQDAVGAAHVINSQSNAVGHTEIKFVELIAHVLVRADEPARENAKVTPRRPVGRSSPKIRTYPLSKE